MMKILLFGEFSGFMNCLKSGLQQLGHEVFLASNGDQGRDYPSDFRWDAYTKGKLGKLKMPFYAANIMAHRRLLKGFDVVYFISPNNVSLIRWLNAPIYNYIVKHNTLSYVCGAGLYATAFDFWCDSDTKYHYYCEGYFLDGNRPPQYHNPQLLAWERELFDKIDGYIPIWYEYAEPYRERPITKKTIRIPIDIKKFEYKPNVITDGKIVFYHGVTRACKGTRFIKPAFDRMQQKYGDQAEFILGKHLPFEEYMRVMERANVVVDDANSYSIAMNGLFALQKGKIVMGGAEPLANKELGIEGVNPVFNINPDVDQICETIEYIIKNKDRLEEWGLKGRKFVEKYHDSVQIAQQYIDLWTDDLKKKESEG